MDYIRFFINNKRLISFGFILTFFSSFGQTFLISLYVPNIMADFDLSNSSFGGFYAAATVTSSLLLAYIGKLIDHTDLRKYTLLTTLTLISACLLLAFSINVYMILPALLGLRLAGQGLLSHISNTSISKSFDKSRGKALSLTTLGYSTGEGLFPIFISLIIGLVGWRYSMAINSVFIGFILIPFIWFALSKKTAADPSLPLSHNDSKFSRMSLFQEKDFYILAINGAALPFFVTGLFFYQSVLAAEKGWTMEWLSLSFIGFAIGRTIFSLFSGKLIDKYSAVKIFPFHLIPFLIGLIMLLILDHIYGALIYLTLTGISVGLSTTMKPAAIAEVYGLKNLGSIKSLFATLAVLSTALSPLLFGLFLDNGYKFIYIIFAAAITVAVIVIVGSRYLFNPGFAVERTRS